MNEFSKQELESIISWGDVYCEFGTSWVFKQNKSLMDKIASMIYNYCEHESNGTKGLTPSTQCVKCGIRYDN